jgi:hypothetical protein
MTFRSVSLAMSSTISPSGARRQVTKTAKCT